MTPLRIGIFGGGGRLGAALIGNWSATHHVTGFARPQLDLLDSKTIDACFESGPFDWVINCAANTNVDACETDRAGAMTANAEAPRHIAEHCANSGARLIQISTDYVFDGTKDVPYHEEDPVSPISIYGESKADGDAAALTALPSTIIARVSWVFGPEKPSFIDAILKKARTDPHAAAVADKWSNPTYTEDLADWLMALIVQNAPGGHYHLCNSGGCTWRDYGEHGLKCAAAAGIPLQTTIVEPISLSDISAFVAKRPVNTVMSSEKFTSITGITPRPWEEAVADYIQLVAARETVLS